MKVMVRKCLTGILQVSNSIIVEVLFFPRKWSLWSFDFSNLDFLEFSTNFLFFFLKYLCLTFKRTFQSFLDFFFSIKYFIFNFFRIFLSISHLKIVHPFLGYLPMFDLGTLTYVQFGLNKRYKKKKTGSKFLNFVFNCLFLKYWNL